MIVHVVLVSDQVLPNLIPILMDQPQRVYLVTSTEMARRGAARRLVRQFKDRAIDVTECTECPDAGFVEIQAFANRVAETVVNDDADAQIVLNATGSNKLMSFGFVEAFRGIASRILYTDTAHRRIEYLPSMALDHDSEAPAPTPMSNVLDVPAYLRAQGFQFRRAASDCDHWQEQAAARKGACKFLGKEIGNEQLQIFVRQMNRLAGQALEQISGSYAQRLAAPQQSFSKPPRGIWKEAMAVLSDAGLVSWESGSEYFQFADVAAAQFLRGGWLEDYAYHIVKDAGVYDARLNVEGAWDNEQAMQNEFDVLACHLNQLLFIECKTLHWTGENDNEVAYKLDSLGEDARGLFGSTWLLSAREPTETLMARANRARIRLVPPAQLQDLRGLVREWRG